MQETTERQRLYSLDNIRALAIILVVFGHSIILYSSSWHVYNTFVDAPLLDFIKSVINLVQMPLFFSLSGFLLRRQWPRYSSLKVFIFKKKRRD